MEKEKRLTVADLIRTGVFTAVYFVLVTIATFACGALLGGVAYILIAAVAALISGSVYMLLAAKVQKFGAITIMGVVMGLFFFVSGHFVLSFLANIICGVAADLLSCAGHYRKKGILLAGYAVFSLGLTGPVLPLWLMRDAYVENLAARGKDEAYIENVFRYINTNTFLICLLVTVICAVIGGIIGQRIVKKHFEKAGIV